MSINNSYRVTVQSGVVAPTRTVEGLPKNRIVTEVNPKTLTYKESTTSQSTEKLNSSFETESLFSNTAQELFYNGAEATKTVNPFAYNRFQNPVFSSASSADTSNQVEVKRHQNYFNQIMNFENPVGSWIDRRV